MPVDIRALVTDHAAIESVAFPLDIRADAVALLGRRPPLVIVNSRRAVVRQSFTLAHELGHVLLPWHAGESFCEPLNRLQTPGASGTEGQANVFASEVLVPRRELVAAGDVTDPESRLRAAMRANISDIAAMRAVADSLDPGFGLVLTQGSKVLASSVSPGTYTPTPYPGWEFDSDRYVGQADRSGEITLDRRSIWWWHLASPSPAQRRSEEGSAQLLRAILDDLSASTDDRWWSESARSSINGIVGSANSVVKDIHTEDEFVALLRQRFAGRVRLRPFVEHELFPAYLWARAEDLADRRQR